MGIKLSRQKPRNILTSVIYRVQKILPFSHRYKIKLFLDLEWIFERLTHEMSFKNYSPETHPIRQCSKKFILDNLDETSCVLDLGCNLGDISFIVAEKAKKVVGIDYNKTAIEIAKNRYQRQNLEFHHGEAFEFLKGSTEHFDVLILSHILEHLDNPQEFLDKYKSNFNTIYIELPDFERSYLNYYRNDLGVKLIYSDNDHISEFDRDELKTLLNNCKLEIINEEYRYGLIKLWCKNKE
jgi:SAM-dependent methyltransferase